MLARGRLFAICSVLIFGCTEPPGQTATDPAQEIIDNLLQVGYPASDITVFEGVVYAGRDAAVSLAASREMLRSDEHDHDEHDHGHEQFRTSNLIGPGVTKICINAPEFTGVFSTALDLAIQNYAEQPIRFTMARAPSTGCSVTISAVFAPGGTRFFAEFPSGGLPGPRFTIGETLNQFNLDTMEHVMTHEIGHTLGFRHTDFFNRTISCGTGGAESSDAGEIHVPGTPTGATVGGSLMNSCFRSTETGEFTANDITALRTLYTPTQSNWRWCHKCQGLFFAGLPGSRCPAGGAHENLGSGNYHPAHDLAPTTNWQSGWRWCHKCQGMFFGGNPGSVCPAGGAHDGVGSGNYSFLNEVGPGASLQDGWRWCSKCQGIHFGGNVAASKCPAGGTHTLIGSGNYSLFNL